MKFLQNHSDVMLLMIYTFSKHIMCRKSSNYSHHTLGSWEKQFSKLRTRSRVGIMHRCSCLTPERTCKLKLKVEHGTFLKS